MGLSLDEMKDLITFGRELGLEQIHVDTLKVVYGQPMNVLGQQLPADEPVQSQDFNTSKLPEELRHYSAQGKAAWGKVP